MPFVNLINQVKLTLIIRQVHDICCISIFEFVKDFTNVQFQLTFWFSKLVLRHLERNRRKHS